MKNNNQLEKISNFVIFKTEEGKVNIDVFFAHDTLWLTQKIMAELFDTTKQNISLHFYCPCLTYRKCFGCTG